MRRRTMLARTQARHAYGLIVIFILGEKREDCSKPTLFESLRNLRLTKVL